MSEIKILEVTENEDGSANVEIELTPEAKEMLINVGFNKILADYVEKTLDKP